METPTPPGRTNPDSPRSHRDRTRRTRRIATDVNVTQPRTRQAEHYKEQSGVSRVDRPAAHGGATVGGVQHGDWIMFEPYRLGDASAFTARVSAGGAGGTIELRAGAPDGRLLGSARVAGGGGWDGATFTTVTGAISRAPARAGKICFVFTGGSGDLFEIDEIAFTTPS